MAILAFGTSLAELYGTTAGISVNTTAARMAPGVAEGISFTSSTGGFGYRRLDFPASSEIWLSFYLKETDTDAGNRQIGIQIVSGSTVLFQWGGSSINNKYNFWQYNNGAGFTTIGSGSSSSAYLVRDSLHRIDVHIKMDDTTGVIEYYVDEILVSSFSGDTIRTAALTMDGVLIRSIDASNGGNVCTYSAIIVADEDTRDLMYLQGAVNGDGAETAWTGDYTAVDETGVNTVDGISSANNGDVETFSKVALLASLSDYEVYGVGLNAVAKRGATGPQNLQLAVRSGSTNVFSASKALDLEYTAYPEVFTVNPATAAPWTFAEADAAQVGVKAVT